MTPKVLVVDDDDTIREVLLLRLRASGFVALPAVDGFAALRVAQEQRPDLILLDLGLPGGDGFKVLERLRLSTKLHGIPVVVLSSGDPALNEDKVRQAGAVAYFQKPPDLDKLVAALRGLLPRADSGAAAGRRKILLIEDDADLRLVVAGRLSAVGYAVAHSADAVSALTVARKENPDLIVLDLGLPGGDGTKILARLRSHPELARVPVVVLTSRDQAQAGPEVFAMGVAAYLQKPADLDSLVAAVKKALETP